MTDGEPVTRRTALLTGSTVAMFGLAGCSGSGIGIEQTEGGLGDQEPLSPTRTAAGDYIRTKAGYRHVAAKPLPTTSTGAVDVERIVIDASMTTAVLTPAVEKRARDVVDTLVDGDTESALARWEDTLRASKDDSAPLDLEALIQFVLREAYLTSIPDLRYTAMQVKYFDEQKMGLRKWLAEARRTRDSMPADCGNGPELCSLQADIERFIRVLEAQLEEPCEGDSELATVDLQQAMQKQQQTLEVLSDVSKRLHDTAMAIIRNVS